MTADKSEILSLELLIRAMYAALLGDYDLPGGICDMAGPARAALVHLGFDPENPPEPGAIELARQCLALVAALCPGMADDAKRALRALGEGRNRR